MTQTRLETFASREAGWRSFLDGRTLGADPPVPEGLLSATVSAADLQVWQSRAASGPYKNTGDVSQNSPGDWTRILSRASQFNVDPTLGRAIGPYASGYTSNPLSYTGGSAGIIGKGIYLTNAAFAHLVGNDPSLGEKVKSELLWHFQTGPFRQGGNDDFADRSRWPYDAYGDGGPAHDVADWMCKMALSYGYMLAAEAEYGSVTFTTSEKSAIEYSIRACAEYWTEYNDRYLEDIWGQTRYDGTYVNQLSQTFGGRPYYGSTQQFSTHHLRYNNRKMVNYTLAAIAGVLLDDAHMKDRAKLYVKEWLAYSVFEDGFFGEFDRWASTLPDLGWGYSGILLSTIAGVVQPLALHGDTELLTYSTTDGIFGSESTTPKTLKFAVDEFLKYPSDQYTRYGTSSSANLNNAYRIDGRNPRDGSDWATEADTWVAPISMLLNDADQRDIYTRQHPGTVDYVTRDSGNYRGDGGTKWAGGWSIYPGVLFMYGQREDV